MGTEWIWVIIVIAIIFGASRLPLLGRNVGVGIKEFKKGIAEGGKDDAKEQPGTSGTGTGDGGTPKA